MAPNLEGLQLVSILQDSNGSRWDWKRFSKHIQSLSLQLKRFHFSMFQEVLPDDELHEAAFSICPHARDRTFSHYDLTPTVVRTLTELQFFLTSLEILPPPNYLCHPRGWSLDEQVLDSVHSGQPLHQFLCEGPSLRHLKTLKMAYLLDFMDIHRRLEMYTPRKKEGEGQPTVATLNGRENPYSLEAGLCLLSRLVHLEPVKERARLETDTGASSVRRTAAAAARGDDVELMTGLQKLGLLQDVRDMVLEMDGDNFVCLPELYQLAVGQFHLEQTPEKEMRSTFARK
ncbi:hypothetical protein BGZ90_010724 [Linnemannia elongata]|nr:hypothetical protein BGZ90_010724 [Linnemannia elongata]